MRKWHTWIHEKKLYEDFGASKLQNKLQQNRLYILWNTLCIGSNITIIFCAMFYIPYLLSYRVSMPEPLQLF